MKGTKKKIKDNDDDNEQEEDDEKGKMIASINELVRKITSHKLSDLDNIKDQISMELYHEVFYRAVDDGKLRFVYDQILGRLDEIYLRDKDAIHFISTRDWKIIEKSFKKSTKSLHSQLKMHRQQTLHKSSKYKMYNRAYFQEIIISNQIEERTKFLFEQKFLSTIEEINQVLQMYCQIDDLEQFYKYTHGRTFTEEKMEKLFIDALKFDSFKIAFQIHEEFGIKWTITKKKRFEDPKTEPKNLKVLTLMESMQQSQYYFEIKMYFIKQAFSIFTVKQMEALLVLFWEILMVNNPKVHPLVNCYNPVKVSILIYEICWEIQQKNIFSLQIKCEQIMKYLIKSLDSYFEKQGNINHLYRLMREPVLHPKNQRDAMDMMLHMNMDALIQHKVVEEVLNLVYDGKYSIDQNPIYLSSLWYINNQIDTISSKSVLRRMF